MIFFNGANLSEFIKVLQIGGRGPISQVAYRQDVPGKEGSRFVRKLMIERIIPVTFMVLGNSLEGLRDKVDELNLILNTENEAPIIFSDEPSKTYYGILDGSPNWEEIISIGRGRGTIYFVCSDPKKNGLEKTYDFINNQVTLQNNGTASSFPIYNVTFTASATDFKVQLGDKYVRVIRNFVVGDQLVIDSRTRKIIYNNLVNMPLLDLRSRWFELLPGQNTMSVSPTNKANVSVTFQERWL